MQQSRFNFNFLSFRFYVKLILADIKLSFLQFLKMSTGWKSAIKRDHDFYGKINIISVKSTFC